MFFTIAFPIILILVFGTHFHEPGQRELRPLRAGPRPDRTRPRSLVKTLELNGKFKITRVDPAVNATQYAKDNKVNLVLIIPKGYERSLMQQDDAQRPQRIRHHHLRIRPQLFFGVHEDADPERGVRRDKPGDVREAAVHQVGRDIDTHQEIPVHRVLHPRHHRDGGDDR